MKPGEAYQFDWSHEIVVMDGVTTIVKVAHVRLCHSRPRPDLRLGLDIPFVAELRRLRTDDLPNHLPRNAKVAANRLDRHLSREIRQTNFGYRLHNQHLELGLPNNQEACVDPYPRGPD